MGRSRADRFRHVASDLVAARPDGWTQRGPHFGGGDSHPLEGERGDAPDGAPPTGVREAQGPGGGVAQEHGEAVRRENAQERPRWGNARPGITLGDFPGIVRADHAETVNLPEETQGSAARGILERSTAVRCGEVSSRAAGEAVNQLGDGRESRCGLPK